MYFVFHPKLNQISQNISIIFHIVCNNNKTQVPKTNKKRFFTELKQKIVRIYEMNRCDTIPNESIKLVNMQDICIGSEMTTPTSMVIE